MSKQSIHDGHRARVRKNVVDNGFSQLEDHKLLELLLFYAIPRGDTNDIAHALLNQFGSLGGVLSASVEELQKVNGVGESTAVYLAGCHELLTRVARSDERKKPICKTAEDLKKLIHPSFLNCEKERIYLFCFDRFHRFIRAFLLAEGDSGSGEINYRYLTECAVSSKACFAVLAHNHPFVTARPSLADIDTTRSVAVHLRRLDISLADHLIFGTDNTVYAFSEDEKYNSYLN